MLQFDACRHLPQNMKRLVREPTGCGEQNMITFVPNIVLLRYMKQMDMLTEGLRERTTANMLAGKPRYTALGSPYNSLLLKEYDKFEPGYVSSPFVFSIVIRSLLALGE